MSDENQSQTTRPDYLPDPPSPSPSEAAAAVFRVEYATALVTPQTETATGCASSNGGSGCSAFALIHPDVGYETRWTPREQRDVLAHDVAYQALCGQ